MAKLTLKRRLFAHEYMVDLNGAQAAIRAGFAPGRAKQTASDLLKDPDVCELITELQGQRAQSLEADARMVLQDLMSYRQANIKQIYDENGVVKSIHEWPDFFTRMGVISLKSKEEYVKDDEGNMVFSGYIRDVKWADPTKIIALIGKHIDINAFRETKVVDVADPLKQFYEQVSGNTLKPSSDAPGLGKTEPPGIPQNKPKPVAPMLLRPK